MTRRRILYIQFTNPGGYPPLGHSSRILADSGWEVLFLGMGAWGADTLQFLPHARVSVLRISFCPAGWKQKVHYLRYALWVVSWAVRWQPGWIYASDPLSSPIALLLAFFPGLNVLYHEHDSPSFREERRSWFIRLILATRSALARRAALCILPNEDRRKQFVAETGRVGETFLVWNCPSREEVTPPRGGLTKKGLTLFYHGSIVPARLPRILLEALRLLPASVELRIAGYDTIGYPGYTEQFLRWAAELGIVDRVKFIGVVPIRRDLFEQARRCDVGFAAVMEQKMEGASNKAFDYLACGLAVLVSNLPGWKRMYVDPGYDLACDPEDPKSIAEALQWFLEHPNQMRLMGEGGRQRILTEWNYERQFAPVLERLTALVQSANCGGSP